MRKPIDLNQLDPEALSAAMRGGTEAWGVHGSSLDHIRYAQPYRGRGRKVNCPCCKRPSTHLGMCNGVPLMAGCEFRVRRWIRDPIAVFMERA